jgi:hypothetical protein
LLWTGGREPTSMSTIYLGQWEGSGTLEPDKNVALKARTLGGERESESEALSLSSYESVWSRSADLLIYWLPSISSRGLCEVVAACPACQFSPPLSGEPGTIRYSMSSAKGLSASNTFASIFPYSSVRFSQIIQCGGRAPLAAWILPGFMAQGSLAFRTFSASSRMSSTRGRAVSCAGVGLRVP